MIYLIRVFGLAILCGITEGMLLNANPEHTTGDRVFLNHFSAYHIVLLFFLMLFGLRFDQNKLLTLYSLILFLPGIIIAQDFFSHFVTRRGGKVFGKWAKWPIDSLWAGVPYFYWLLLSLQIFFVLLYNGIKKL